MCATSASTRGMNVAKRVDGALASARLRATAAKSPCRLPVSSGTGQVLVEVLDDGAHELLLGAVAAVERRLADARALTHLLHRERPVAVLDEHLERRAHDREVGLRGAGPPGRARGGLAHARTSSRSATALTVDSPAASRAGSQHQRDDRAGERDHAPATIAAVCMPDRNASWAAASSRSPGSPPAARRPRGRRPATRGPCRRRGRASRRRRPPCRHGSRWTARIRGSRRPARRP